MKEQIIKDLMEAVHDVAKIKGENEALKKENEFLKGLLTKQLNILPVMPSAIEQFSCRFSDIQNMVKNNGITKENLISIQLIDTNNLHSDLYKVVHWA